MAFSVQMPELGESVTEGTVTRWLKQVGDTVEKDEPLLEVSTDKVDTEIPSPTAGTLQRTVAGEDDTVEVGGELAVIDDGSGGGGATAAEPAQQQTQQPEQAEQPQQAEQPPQQAPQQAAPAAAEQQTQQPAGDTSTDSGSPVTMPELGESVTEGTVTRWLKQVGDTVEKDEPLLEVSTDKVDTEIPSPMGGTLLSISANEDDTVDVGGQLATIGSGSAAPAQQQAAPAQEAPAEPEQAPQQQQAQQQPAAPEPEPTPQPEMAQPAQQDQTTEQPPAGSDGGTSAPYVTPLVRKLATEHDVDLATVTGSGVGGRIRKQDVLAAAGSSQQQTETPAQPAAAAPAQSATAAPSKAPATRSDLAGLRGTTQKASRIRQITAKTTREALQNSAQLTQTFEVDVTRIAALRSRAKAAFAEREGVNLTYLPFFAKAAVEALKAHPNVNASYDEENAQITYHDAEHLGIAVDTDRGLLDPVIHNAGDLSLGGLARAIADLAERTRTRKVTPDELSGATFTITNIGSHGGLFDTPILAPPQGAMLATGAIVKRPAVIPGPDGEDTVAIRSMCYLPLTYDHRLIDGADAGRFLATIKNRLEEGAFENDLGL